MTHRFFTDHTYTGGQGLRELPPPPWTSALPAEFRYPYDALEYALPQIKAEGLRFYVTKEAYALPAYGRDVVAVLLQEERCKVPVYGRHVRAVIRNLHSRPFLGWGAHLPPTPPLAPSGPVPSARLVLSHRVGWHYQQATQYSRIYILIFSLAICWPPYYAPCQAA